MLGRKSMNYGKKYDVLRGCSMATSSLYSQNFRFQITIYIKDIGIFSINTFMCALK
jgi:hypothetical protein